MKRIKNIDKFFNFDVKNNKLIFIGNTLNILIPQYYEDRKLLTIEESINTVGIFKIQIDEKFEAVLMMTIMMLLSPPDEISNIKEGEESYYSLKYNKNSEVMNNIILIKKPEILYKLYMTFFALGKIPSFIDYDSLSFIYDNDKLLGGMNLNSNHIVYEMMVAHIFRDSKNPFKFYRYTNMKNPPTIVSLHSVSHGPISSTAKLAGSYFDDALTSSMVTEHDKDSRYELENILRV